MKIHCLFILRKGEETPELLNAIDDESYREAEYHFDEECKERLAKVGKALVSHVYTAIHVNTHDVMAQLGRGTPLNATLEDNVPNPPPVVDEKAPGSICQNFLMNQGSPYPRTCPTCGLLGKCSFNIERKQKPLLTIGEHNQRFAPSSESRTGKGCGVACDVCKNVELVYVDNTSRASSPPLAAVQCPVCHNVQYIRD